MNVLYTVLAVTGTVMLTALFVLVIFFRIKINFRIKPKKGSTIPIEEFVPRTVYGIAAFVAVLGYIGLLLSSLSLPWWLTILPDIAFSMFINFIGAHFFVPFAKNLYFGKLPDPDELTDTVAVCLENIDGDSYGKVRFKYGGREFVRDCISANHTSLAKGEKVVIITGEDNLLFVEKTSEIYDALKEEEENAI